MNKAVSIALGIILSVLIIACIYGLIVKDNMQVFYTLLIVPIALSPIFIILYQSLSKIKAELSSRE